MCILPIFERLVLNYLHASQIKVLTFYWHGKLKYKRNRGSQSVFSVLWTFEMIILNKLAKPYLTVRMLIESVTDTAVSYIEGNTSLMDTNHLTQSELIEEREYNVTMQLFKNNNSQKFLQFETKYLGTYDLITILFSLNVQWHGWLCNTSRDCIITGTSCCPNTGVSKNIMDVCADLSPHNYADTYHATQSREWTDYLNIAQLFLWTLKVTVYSDVRQKYLHC